MIILSEKDVTIFDYAAKNIIYRLPLQFGEPSRIILGPKFDINECPLLILQ